MPQESIGPYRIVRELGHGGQGTVYLAEDSKLGRKVALKVLTGIPGLAPKSVQRFKREAEITARLDHPGVCTTYDFGESDGVPWIAMRYVEGETLAAKIFAARHPSSVPTSTSEHLSFARDIPTTPSVWDGPPAATVSTSRSREEIAWVVGVIEQTARSLHAAHENGVVHRDIKPANIMVTPEGGTVILDFGVANVMQTDGATLTKTGDLMGTPQYMAPEQLTRDAIQIDRRADVYSLGVTLYEALTLTRPFDSPTREQIYQAILAKDPPDPHRVNPMISRDLSAVVATAIEKDRDRRYQTALAFADDLRRTLERQPVLARRAGPFRRLAKWAERNPAVALSSAALLVVLVSALVVTLTLLRHKYEALSDRERALTDLERLSDVKRIDELKAEAEGLFPLLPSKAPAMSDWLGRARLVASRLPIHEQALTALVLSGARVEDQWKRDRLAELVDKLKEFTNPDPHVGAIADVANRLAVAETISQRTVGDFADRWTAAAASIADLARSPKYGGLKLPPQVGLVPLGRNPTTGLWEFADVLSGTLPEADSREAAYEVEDDAAVVLVLVPGGSFKMGSPPGEKGRSADEAIREVRIEPFFVGKFEVTQAQWIKVMGSNPSTLKAGSGGITLRNPVESVDWKQASDFARRLNLALPTEAQWEYACRAGTETAFAFGPDLPSLKGNVNVRDQSLVKMESPPSGMEAAPWNDQWPQHAPVNALGVNAFGLFGLHGNVTEWCLDRYEGSSDRCARDGSWFLPAEFARSAARHFFRPGTCAPTGGLRVARPLLLP